MYILLKLVQEEKENVMKYSITNLKGFHVENAKSI